MFKNALKRHKNGTYYLIITISFLLLLFIKVNPSTTLAQDEKSIATLRQMGKAFASVAEKASPAVVAIKAERTVTQQYRGYGESPYGSPFGDDFFDYFFRRRSPHLSASR